MLVIFSQITQQNEYRKVYIYIYETYIYMKHRKVYIYTCVCIYIYIGDFLPKIGSDEPERRTLGQSLARTDKFISAVKPFYRSRNKELRVYSQPSAYRVNT